MGMEEGVGFRNIQDRKLLQGCACKAPLKTKQGGIFVENAN
jgi:hypothetical protein